ncbi:restriction endonuclease subunit M, partial [Capnocytophaga cynodegmi]
VGFLKTDPKARYQGYMFYFREGFCWSNVLTTYIKCRIKEKTIYSTESMSLFSIIDSVPEYYMVCIINAKFIAYYIDSFVNSTSHCTTGDAKQIPIIIPSKEELQEFEKLFNSAIEIKKKQFDNSISESEAEVQLTEIQSKLDIMVNTLYSV